MAARFPRLEPVGGREADGFAGFHGGETGEDVLEVFPRVQPQTAAVLDKGVNDGGFFSGVLGSDEEPVLGSELGGPDGVLNEVVVDLDPSVPQIGLELGPLVEGVGDGFDASPTAALSLAFRCRPNTFTGNELCREIDGSPIQFASLDVGHPAHNMAHDRFRVPLDMGDGRIAPDK